MSGSIGEGHVYSRDISQDRITSLSVIAGYVNPSARVLDLGTGSGALGKHLKNELQCSVDGVTYNEHEAQLARPHYRHVEVADLDSDVWANAFLGQTYDFIVCADVIEHLRRPETVLHTCRSLLKPGGKLLISVPNAAYCGLIAELMEGDFAYRDEGLLDKTHLRFFTRKSLVGFLSEQGWLCDLLDSVELAPSESEFNAQLDRLPPAVERYLVSLPDANVYQLLVVARPARDTHQAELSNAHIAAHHVPGVAKALFSAQLYAGDAQGFLENHKVVVAGEIGVLRQTLRFELPRSGFTRLRLDPADRPGFLHLHQMRLLSASSVVWQWRVESDGITALAESPQHEMTLRLPWGSTAGAMVLLYGDDPWIELPIAPDVIRQCAQTGDGVFELQLGWPMSADFLSFSEILVPMRTEITQLRSGIGLAQQQVRDTTEMAFELRAERDRAQALASEAENLAQREREAALATQIQIAQAVSNLQQAEAAAEAARNDAARNHSEKMQAFADLAQARDSVSDARTQLAVIVTSTSQRLDTQQIEYELVAQENRLVLGQKNDLIVEKNLGVRQQLLLRAQLNAAAREKENLAAHLKWIENSTVFRVTRPLVHAKMAITSLFRPKPVTLQLASTGPTAISPSVNPVDIIVPVYRGLEDTQLCIQSVLRSQCFTPWRLIVVNDASPQPEVTRWLREICPSDSRILLLENSENLGFVATVNRGMSVSDSNDVLLLNSDTEVANDWLDRLKRAAYSDKRVASVTPFSNNATICSYPNFCESNDLPLGWNTAALDKLCAEVNDGQVVDVPTGVGFCMYIRRDSLNDVGLFDVEQFGKGYGEENDFCCRAQALGWRNLHALDTFVLHTGGVSFGDSKSEREREAVEKLRRLHPSYEPEVHAFVKRDPASLARFALDVARIRAPGKPCVLAVLHDRAGGTLRHVHELAAHLAHRVQFLVLTPEPGGSVLLNTLLADGASLNLRFRISQDWAAFLQTLQMLGVTHIHYHHLLGHHGEIFGLADELGLTFDFTAHDYFSICPQISLTDYKDKYCGQEGESQCIKCLQRTPAPGNSDIVSWRRAHGHLLTRARYVFTPSRDAGAHLLRILPLVNLRYAPHTDIADLKSLPSPQVSRLMASAPLRVVIVGGMSRIKGADLLADVATLAAKQLAPVEFHLLGHAYRSLPTQPKASLTVHGAYEEGELQQLLEWIKPDLVWFPALWPETYSYTLSACLVAGLPVLAPNLGAFPERLSGRHWSWLTAWDMPAPEMLNLLIQIRTDHFVKGIAPKLNWTVMPLGSAAQTARWSYENDYSAGLASPSNVCGVDIKFLAAFRTVQGAGTAASSVIKAKALNALVQIRSMPAMRSIARAIPLRWQTRVKSWLRA